MLANIQSLLGSQESRVYQLTDEMYDLDIEVRHVPIDAQPVNQGQLITSHSLCTPGCGHTGTGNSFCC